MARTRQYVTTSDGVEHVQTKPPRADVLHYPSGWVTVLVRRTHDVALSRELARARWAELTDLVGTMPLVAHRVGWWATSPGRPWPSAAVDDQDRNVIACEEDRPGAGAGVEWRPDQRAP